GDVPHTPDARLRGPKLALARVGWATLVVLIVAFFLVNLPAYVDQLRTVCPHEPCAPWQLTPASAGALQQLHLSRTGYAFASLIVSLACVSAWFAVAGLIAWRQSTQVMALLTSLLLIEQCIIQLNASFATPLEYRTPTWHAVTVLVNALG